MATASAPRSGERIAVLGGGLAGAYCAHLLAQKGHSVVLFDMGRSGFGGRASTRHSDGNQFDHGCQFIHPKTDAIRQLMRDLQGQGIDHDDTIRTLLSSKEERGHVLILFGHVGVAKLWQGKFGTLNAKSGRLSQSASEGFCGFDGEQEEVWIGMPGMSSICKHLAATQGIEPRWNCKVTNIEHLHPGWRVRGVQKSNTNDSTQDVVEEASLLVVTDPMMALPDLPGSVDFGPSRDLSVLAKMREPRKVPTLTLMAVLAAPMDGLRFDAAIVEDSAAFKWLARDSRKLGRRREDGKECWVAISTPGFAEKTMGEADGDARALSSALEAEFRTLLALIAGPRQAVPELVIASAQRWGSAFKTELCSSRSLLDEQTGLAACGDFCVQSSAEGALLSALDAAERIEKYLKH